MSCQCINNVEFSVENYINISNFKEFCKTYKVSLKDNAEVLLSTVIGCIEGLVRFNINNDEWNICIGNYFIRGHVKSDNNNYILMSLFNFINSNEKYNEFIIKYFNLWHKNDNPFIYDDYHKNELENNFKALVQIMRKDLQEAYKYDDCFVIKICKHLFDKVIYCL